MNSIGGFVSPSASTIAINTVRFFNPSKSGFTNNEQPTHEEIEIDMFVILLYMVIVTINMTVMYYALKFACKNGFTVVQFLLAYFFSLPYLIVQLIMKNTKK